MAGRRALGDVVRPAVLGRVSGLWAVLIVTALGNGPDGGPSPLRYSELARALTGVSSKMLSQTLRSLQRDGLVTRTATATVPVTVTYDLTELGLSLHNTVRQLKNWAQGHRNDIAANQSQFDKQQ